MEGPPNEPRLHSFNEEEIVPMRKMPQELILRMTEQTYVPIGDVVVDLPRLYLDSAGQ
jgi:hypothetical protein